MANTKSDTNSNQSNFEGRLLEATADSALSALAEVGSSAAENLVSAWVRAGNANAVAVAAERGSGAARKAARRGLNVMRARGIKWEPPPHVTSVGAASGPTEAVAEAWFVAADASGNSLIVIASRSPTSRAQSGFFYLQDQMGLHTVNVGTLSGSALKDALKRAGEAGPQPIRISPEYARQRIAAGRELLRSRGVPEPLGLTSAKLLLEPMPSGPMPHPLDNEGLELADEDAHELASKSAALHALPEFRGWLPDRSAVEEMLSEIGQHLPQGGGEQPSSEIVQQLIKDAVEAATDRFFVPERRQVLLSRMKDCALSVLASAGEVRALEVVATMKRIEQAGLITDAPREVPFLRAFFEKAIATLAMQGGGRLQVPIRAGDTQGLPPPSVEATP